MKERENQFGQGEIEREREKSEHFSCVITNVKKVVALINARICLEVNSIPGTADLLLTSSLQYYFIATKDFKKRSLTTKKVNTNNTL